MENLMKTFESQEFGKVRVVEISGNLWWSVRILRRLLYLLAMNWRETNE